MSYAGYRSRGGRGGGRHGRGAGFRADPYYGHHGGPPTPWPAPDEKVVALRQSVIATLAAARQVAREGSQEKAAKATEVLNEARMSLYRILTAETV